VAESDYLLITEFGALGTSQCLVYSSEGWNFWWKHLANGSGNSNGEVLPAGIYHHSIQRTLVFSTNPIKPKERDITSGISQEKFWRLSGHLGGSNFRYTF
jgi:hypothetical protein